MRYPYKVRPDGKYFLVTFPDIPEAITQGESMEQALEAAQDALETALEFYFEDARTVPEPSPIKRGGPFVELPPSLQSPHPPPPRLQDRRHRRGNEGPRQAPGNSRRLTRGCGKSPSRLKAP